jgi:hypothetical protein
MLIGGGGRSDDLETDPPVATTCERIESESSGESELNISVIVGSKVGIHHRTFEPQLYYWLCQVRSTSRK